MLEDGRESNAPACVDVGCQAVRMMFPMWLTEDVVVRRMYHMTEAERTVLSKCALCGEVAKGRRNEHLLFECTAASVMELRKLEGGGSCSGEEGAQASQARARERQSWCLGDRTVQADHRMWR